MVDIVYGKLSIYDNTSTWQNSMNILSHIISWLLHMWFTFSTKICFSFLGLQVDFIINHLPPRQLFWYVISAVIHCACFLFMFQVIICRDVRITSLLSNFCKNSLNSGLNFFLKYDNFFFCFVLFCFVSPQIKNNFNYLESIRKSYKISQYSKTNIFTSARKAIIYKINICGGKSSS